MEYGTKQLTAGEAPDFTTKSEWLYERLKSDIAEGRLQPGERLVATKLAMYYRVSPSPVRDALNRLAQEGFVSVTPHSGAAVASVDGRKLYELVFIRMKMEALAAALAVPLLTEDGYASLESMHDTMREHARNGDRMAYESVNWRFHDYIYASCGNESLYEMVMSLWKRSCITRTVFYRLPDKLEHSLRDHWRWLDASRRGDASEVSRIVHAHIKHTLDRLEQITGNTGSAV